MVSPAQYIKYFIIESVCLALPDYYKEPLPVFQKSMKSTELISSSSFQPSQFSKKKSLNQNHPLASTTHCTPSGSILTLLPI